MANGIHVKPSFLKVPIALCFFILLGFQNAQASARSLSPQEMAVTCTPTSNLLYSDLCHGQVYGQGYGHQNPWSVPTNQNNSMADIYAILNALQGNTAGPQYSMGAILEGSMAPSSPFLWENSNGLTTNQNWFAPQANSVR